MEIHATEEQQLEDLKKWWKENGRSITVGLVLGIGGVVGWTSWRAYDNAQAEKASIVYEQLVNLSNAQQPTLADLTPATATVTAPQSTYGAAGVAGSAATVTIPVWWYAVLAMTSGFNHAVVEGLRASFQGRAHVLGDPAGGRLADGGPARRDAEHQKQP